MGNFFFRPFIYGTAARVYFCLVHFFLNINVFYVSFCIIHHVLMYICEPPRKYTRVCVSKKRKKKKKFYSERRGEPILHIAGKVSRFFPLFFFLFLSIFFLFGFPRSWVIVEMLMAYSFLFSPSFSFFFFSSCCCHPTKYRNVGVCVCVSSLISPRQHFRSVPWKMLSWREKKKKDVLNPSAHTHRQ